jgi:hypothetical protein
VAPERTSCREAFYFLTLALTPDAGDSVCRSLQHHLDTSGSSHPSSVRNRNWQLLDGDL